MRHRHGTDESVDRRRWSRVAGLVWGLALALSVTARAADLTPVPDWGLRIHPGFQVNWYATPEQAPNVTAMSVDAEGRVIIAGPGYIRALPDLDRNGVADTVETWPTWNEAPSGLESLEREWIVSGGSELYSLIDQNEDGIPDDESEDWLTWPVATRSGRAVVLGPEGGWYVGAGDQSALEGRLSGFVRRPFQAPLSGGIVVLGPAQGFKEPLAVGFRNPGGLSFNPWGDLFAMDEGDPSSRGLPWERRSILFKVAPGGQHGWRGREDGHGFGLPLDHPVVASPTLVMDFGMPSSLVCYRHYQFPFAFREGFFAADWLMGRVIHVSMRAEGAGYRGEVTPFLDSYGRAGFTPSALAVATDGSLLVAAGGKKAGGGVYRIQYVADRAFAFNATNWWTQALSDLDLVMGVPQPDSAWARHDWIPRSGLLGSAVFEGVALNEGLTRGQRVRAIEILTGHFNGLPADVAAQATAADVEEVRARAAWSLSYHPVNGDLQWLVPMTRDRSAYVRLQALNTLNDRRWGPEMTWLQQALGANLAHPDREVRQAAARLALQLTPVAWDALWARRSQLPVLARLTLLLALHWRDAERIRRREQADEALAIFQSTAQPEERLEALRLFAIVMDADGGLAAPGWFFQQPNPEWSKSSEFGGRWIRRLLEVFPSGHRALDLECSRVLAVLEAEDAALGSKILTRLTAQTLSGDHLHYLAVQARLTQPLETNAYAALAEAILMFGGKRDAAIPAGDDTRQGPWLEVSKRLIERHPGLELVLLRHPRLPAPEHIVLAPWLGADHFTEAAGRFLERVEKDARFPWSVELVRLLESLPGARVHPVLSRQWGKVGLRESIVAVLSRDPRESDREKFLWALESPHEEVVRQGLSGIQRLDPDRNPNHLVPLLRALWRAIPEDGARQLRRQVVELWQSQTASAFTFIEREGDAATREKDYGPIFDAFRLEQPLLYKQAVFTETLDPAAWELKRKTVRWAEGDEERGRRHFQDLGCAYCHEKADVWGPDLIGLAQRQSRDALWDSIVFPNRRLVPAYRVTVVETMDGASHRGAVLEETPELMLLQTAPWRTVRILKSDIRQRYRDARSLMPGGLIDGLDQKGLADLQAYLLGLR